VTIIINVLLFLIGIIALYYGAEYLVRGGANIARIFGIQPIVIGLTVVAFGTSMPEFLVGLQAALKNQHAITIGNVVGSNIANIGLILGLSAVVSPILVSFRMIRGELFFLALASIFFVTLIFGYIQRWEGLIFLFILFAYTYYLIKHPSEHPVSQELPEKESKTWKNIFYLLLGFVGLNFGSDWLVDSAVFFARLLHISEIIIGMTIVAVGTSLPELAASVVAAARKESDISIGNIIGSNLFNMFFVIGGTSLIRPIPVDPQIYHLELPIMLAFTFILIPVIYFNKGISRLWGIIFLIGYLLFNTFLIGFRQI
jgi:cation:H+ antiporter